MDEDVVISGNPQAVYLKGLQQRKTSKKPLAVDINPVELDEQVLKEANQPPSTPTARKPARPDGLLSWLKKVIPARFNLFDEIEPTRVKVGESAIDAKADDELSHVLVYKNIISRASQVLLHPDESPFFDASTTVEARHSTPEALPPPPPPGFPWKSALFAALPHAGLVAVVQLALLALVSEWTSLEKLVYFLITMVTIVIFGAKMFYQYVGYCDTVRHHQNGQALVQFIDLNHRLNLIVKRTLRFIQEIELVSRGYQLSAPLSPVTRLEQTAKSKKCIQLRAQLTESLQEIVGTLQNQNVYRGWRSESERGAFETSIAAIDQSLESLRKEAARVAMEGVDGDLRNDGNVATISELKKLAEKMTLVRSNLLSNTLVAAGCVVIGPGQRAAIPQPRAPNPQHGHRHDHHGHHHHNHDEQLTNLVRCAVIRSLLELLQHISAPMEENVRLLEEMLAEEQSVAKKIEPGRTSNEYILYLAQHLVRLQEQASTSLARLQLCAQDLAALAKLPPSTDLDSKASEEVEEIVRQHARLGQDTEDFRALWTAGNRIVQRFVASVTNTPSTPIVTASECGASASASLPDQPPEHSHPEVDPEMPAVDAPSLEAMILAHLEQVYEASSARPEEEGTVHKSTKPREQRIAVQKQKRQLQAQKKEETFERMAMVSELKEVLETKHRAVVPANSLPGTQTSTAD